MPLLSAQCAGSIVSTTLFKSERRGGWNTTWQVSRQSWSAASKTLVSPLFCFGEDILVGNQKHEFSICIHCSCQSTVVQSALYLPTYGLGKQYCRSRWEKSGLASKENESPVMLNWSNASTSFLQAEAKVPQHTTRTKGPGGHSAVQMYLKKYLSRPLLGQGFLER
jgi:hypothetical protein